MHPLVALCFTERGSAGNSGVLAIVNEDQGSVQRARIEASVREFLRQLLTRMNEVRASDPAGALMNVQADRVMKCAPFIPQ